MKRIIASLLLVSALMASTVGTAFANPWEAGQSDNWKGSATPCKNDGNPSKCPPHG